MANFKIAYGDHMTRAGSKWVPDSNGSMTNWNYDAPTSDVMADLLLDPRVAVAATVDFGGNGAFVITRQIASASEDPLPIGVISLLGHSIADEGTLAIKVFSEVHPNFGTPVYESNASEPIWAPPSGGFGRNFHHFLPEGITGRTVQIIVAGPWVDNIGTIGTVRADQIFTTPDGIVKNWTHGLTDPSKTTFSKGRQAYSGREQIWRFLKGEMVHTEYKYMFGLEEEPETMDVQRLLYTLGTTEPFIIFPRTELSGGGEDFQSIHRLGMYARFSNLGTIQHLGGDLYKWGGWQAEELG